MKKVTHTSRPQIGKEAPRRIAYTSDETGRKEVYVRDFPTGSHKWQVSNQGGLLSSPTHLNYGR